MHAIELIEDFTSNISSFPDYVKDLKTQSAVERQLGIIGEAVNKFDLIHPEISLKNARKIVISQSGHSRIRCSRLCNDLGNHSERVRTTLS